MRQITVYEDQTGYDAVSEALISANNNFLFGSYIVQMQIGYSHGMLPEKTDLQDITEFLSADENGTHTWEHDWWEGQDVIIITGFAPLQDVDISQSFPFE